MHPPPNPTGHTAVLGRLAKSIYISEARSDMHPGLNWGAVKFCNLQNICITSALNPVIDVGNGGPGILE